MEKEVIYNLRLPVLETSVWADILADELHSNCYRGKVDVSHSYPAEIVVTNGQFEAGWFEEWVVRNLAILGDATWVVKDENYTFYRIADHVLEECGSVIIPDEKWHHSYYYEELERSCV